MAARTIGLDVGTHAVRAAEVSFGRGQPTLQRFGQVALPPGAVTGGEVVDPHAVAAALRRLWREVGFKSRTVVTGVANARVVARVTEVPAMPDAELRSSLRYSAQELIPIPLEEAVLDHQVVERFLDTEQQEHLRLLVVAAHRDMLRSLLAALEGAGLEPARIDLLPLALIRALHTDVLGLGLDDRLGLDGPDDGPMAEALVDIGAGVTNVVVHEQGLPRFVRILVSGGNAVSEAVGRELELDPDAAEDLKRRGDSLATDPLAARSGRVVAASITPLLEEIRGSLDFFKAQADRQLLRRVVLTGGASRVPDLVERLHGLLGVPVELGQPLRMVELGNTGFAPGALAEVADVLAVPIGLALSGEPLEGDARRISLLPTEIAESRKERRQLVLAGAVVAAFAALLVALFLMRGGRVDEARTAAELEEGRTPALEAQVAEMQSVDSLEADIASRRQTVQGVLADEVAWTRLLSEVSTVLPSDVWLTSFTGDGSGGEATPATVSFAATGFDQTSAARWLLRLGQLDSLSDLWLPSSARAESTTRELVTFTSDATLSPAAHSNRAERYLGGDG